MIEQVVLHTIVVEQGIVDVKEKNHLCDLRLRSFCLLFGSARMGSIHGPSAPMS